MPYGNLSRETAISLGCQPEVYESLRYKEWKKYVIPNEHSMRAPQKTNAKATQEAQIRAYYAKMESVKELEKKRWAARAASAEKEQQEIKEFEANHRNISSYTFGGNAVSHNRISGQSAAGSLMESSSMRKSGAVTTFSCGGFTTVTPVGGGSTHTIYTGASDGFSTGHRDSCGFISTPGSATPIFDPLH